MPAGQSRPIAVRFQPDQPRGYSARIRVEYRGGDADTAELRGVGYVIPIEVRTTFDSPLFNFRSGSDAGAQVQVRSLNWGGAQIYGFDIRVRYNAKQLLYVPNSITRGEVLDATWQLTAQESLDGTTSTAELLIQGRGQTPIAANGAVATLRFTVLISDLADQRFATTAIAECIPYGAGNSGRRCVIPTVLGDSLLPTTCFIDGRFVKVSTTTFSIVDVSPHPATSDAVTIRFGVGFDAPTSIRFYDALGNPVRTVLDGELSAGTYQLEVPIADMSSGLYFVRYESGPVRITRQLLIVR